MVMKCVMQGVTIPPASSASFAAEADGWYRIVQRIKSNDPTNPAASGNMTIFQTTPLQALATTTDVWPVAEVFLKKTQGILVTNAGPFANVADIFLLDGVQ